MYFSRLLFESNVSFFLCLRSEPYNFDQRRGRNEPEAPAASSKRLYVENQPYLIGGCSPRMPLWNKMASSEPGGYKYSSVHLLKLQESQLDPPGRILSLFDKYNHMKNTYKKRLAFGKSLQMLLFVCFSCSSQLLATRMSILASSQFFLLLYMFSSVPGGYVIIWYIHNLTIFHCCWWNLYTLHHHQTFVQLLHTVYEIFSFIGMKYLPVLIPFDHNLIQIFCWRLREICVPIFFIFYDMIKYLIWAFIFMNFVLQESLVYMDLVSSLNFQLEQETW